MGAEQSHSAITALVDSIGKTEFQRDLLGRNVSSAERYLTYQLGRVPTTEHTRIGTRLINGLSSETPSLDEDTQRTAVRVFSMLDFQGMKRDALPKLKDIYFQAVGRQAETSDSQRSINALYGIGIVLMPQLPADNPTELIAEIRTAWDTVTTSASTEQAKQAISKKVEKIITCFGLSFIQPDATTFFTRLYLDNPDITNEEVQAAIKAQESTDEIQDSRWVKSTQLVYLYKNLRYDDIATVTGLTNSQVQWYIKKLRKEKLIEKPSQVAIKDDSVVPQRREKVVELRNAGLFPIEISHILQVPYRTVHRDLYMMKDRITAPSLSGQKPKHTQEEIPNSGLSSNDVIVEFDSGEE